MKRITAIILSLAMVFALTSCGGQSGTGAPQTSAPETSAPETAAPETTAPDTTGPSFDEAVKLTFATAGKAGSLSALMYENWMDMVTERSGGKITFDYQPGGVLGNEGELFQQIMDGVIEAGGGGIATYTNYNTLAEVYQLPSSSTPMRPSGPPSRPPSGTPSSTRWRNPSARSTSAALWTWACVISPPWTSPSPVWRTWPA